MIDEARLMRCPKFTDTGKDHDVVVPSDMRIVDETDSLFCKVV